jgi:hypothetical protein
MKIGVGLLESPGVKMWWPMMEARKPGAEVLDSLFDPVDHGRLVIGVPLPGELPAGVGVDAAGTWV